MRPFEFHDDRTFHVAAAPRHVAIQAVGIGEHAHSPPLRIRDRATPLAGRAVVLELHIAVAELAAGIGLVRARLAVEPHAAAALALVARARIRPTPGLRDLILRLEQLLRILIRGVQTEVRRHRAKLAGTTPALTIWGVPERTLGSKDAVSATRYSCRGERHSGLGTRAAAGSARACASRGRVRA